MSFFLHEMFIAPPESYSRLLDERVAASEMPYGYVLPPPPADTNDFDQARLESKKECAPRHRR